MHTAHAWRMNDQDDAERDNIIIEPADPHAQEEGRDDSLERVTKAFIHQSN